MQQETIAFASGKTTFCFDASLNQLQALAPPERSFILTDEHLDQHYHDAFRPWKTVVVPPGESSKNLSVLDDIVRQLIALEAGRDAILIGIGGGVVTDMAGFVAGIYKRGIGCVLVPTSILAMVDAAIGGKNGLDVGAYKNMIGLVRQPDYILYDHSFTETLPEEEWINGFAEIIKHACIGNAGLFAFLEKHNLSDFRRDRELLSGLIRSNVLQKASVVQKDELEKNIRKYLNFGHTLGHAIEYTGGLPHGHAVSIGMAFAAELSGRFEGFRDAARVTGLLQRYGLPVSCNFDPERAMELMAADKKRAGEDIAFVLLKRIGEAGIRNLPLSVLSNCLKEYLHEGNDPAVSR